MINPIVNSGFPSSTAITAEEQSRAAETKEALQPSLQPQADRPAQQPPIKESEPQQLENAVSQLNDFAQNIRRTLNFSVEEVTGQTVVQVYDSETDELIRQIPSEQAIKLASTIEEQARSLLLSEQV